MTKQQSIDELRADLAAANERAAALAAAYMEIRRRLHFVEEHNQIFERCESGWCHSDRLNDKPFLNYGHPPSILAAVRRAAKREALHALYKTFSERLTGIPGSEMRWATGRIFEILNAALAALDAEEKGEQNG